LETARISVEDVGASVRDYAGGIHASPEHLAQAEDRLALLDRLKRKYGPSLDEVIQFGVDVSRKLSEVENKDEILRGLRGELAKAAGEYLRASRTLSKKRGEAARRLEKLVEVEINDLAMKSVFRIEMTISEEEGNWTSSGIDQVVYMISTNPGEPLRPLEHIASGGELSRVMLALSGFGGGAGAGTLVFDEIDAGVGGKTARAVGERLRALGENRQVLCITHLPQVASLAETHFTLEKDVSGERASATVRRLDGESVVEEILRMLGGERSDEAAARHARELLAAA
jgi:DNA repair protein RecN (Recombination protein N)